MNAWLVTNASGEEKVSLWYESVEHRDDLTSRVKQVLHQAFLEVHEVCGHLISTYTDYTDVPEDGHHCRHLIQRFADGRWAFFWLEESRKGAFGRDSTTYVRLAPELMLEGSYEHMGGVALRHYSYLPLLKDAGLLTEAELAEQQDLEQQRYQTEKAAHDQRFTQEEADRVARKAQREEEQFQRMLKKKGLRTVPEGDEHGGRP